MIDSCSLLNYLAVTQGVIGAMMNTAFQLGATVGLASQWYSCLSSDLLAYITSSVIVITAITLGVNKSDPVSQYKGYQASFWSIIGMHGIVIIMSMVFVKQVQSHRSVSYHLRASMFPSPNNNQHSIAQSPQGASSSTHPLLQQYYFRESDSGVPTLIDLIPVSDKAHRKRFPPSINSAAYMLGLVETCTDRINQRIHLEHNLKCSNVQWL